MREPRHQTKSVRPQVAKPTDHVSYGRDAGAMSTPPPCIRMRKPADQRLMRLIQIVESSPQVSMQRLSKTLYLSKSRIEHLFKAETGIALKTYLVAHRLAHAARLLQSGGLRVKEVAQLTGYAHTGSLTRAFQSMYGVNPKAHQTRKSD